MYGRNKFLYIAVLIPSLVLPTAPGIAAFATGGFVVRAFPSFLCATKSGAVLYYTIILPMSVMTGIGASLLIITIAELIKVMKTALLTCIISCIASSFCSEEVSIGSRTMEQTLA